MSAGQGLQGGLPVVFQPERADGLVQVEAHHRALMPLSGAPHGPSHAEHGHHDSSGQLTPGGRNWLTLRGRSTTAGTCLARIAAHGLRGARAGCEHPADHRAGHGTPPATPVQVDGAQGPLSAARSKAIVDRLKAGGKETNIFDIHLASRRRSPAAR